MGCASVEGWVVHVCVNMYFELTLEVTSCLSASHAFSQVGIVGERGRWVAHVYVNMHFGVTILSPTFLSVSHAFSHTQPPCPNVLQRGCHP